MRPKRRVNAQVVELTRRTTQRTYFFRPGSDTRELLGYMYGKAALDHAQVPIVASWLSTHGHSVQTDLRGQRSAFMQQFFSNTARKRNLQLNRRENLFAARAPGDMVALDLDEIVNRVVYTCLQPVAANLVERASDWTGFQILPEHWGKPMRFKRPDRCGEDMPEWVEFTPMPPPGFEDKPLAQVIKFFEALIRKGEKRLARKRRGPVKGIAYCEAINPFHCPKTSAPMRKLNPRFACKDRRRIIAAIQCERQFYQEHRAALNDLRSGNRNAIFPAGTLQIVLLAGVDSYRCRADDPHATRLEWSERLRKMWDDVFKRPTH